VQLNLAAQRSVEITATRPLSKRKRWRLLRVITRSKLAASEAFDETAQIMQDITGKKPSEEVAQ